MNLFYCQVTDTIITEDQLRQTRANKLRFSSDIENWSENVYTIGKFRRVHSSPRPPGRGWKQSFEEREGQLYQIWNK